MKEKKNSESSGKSIDKELKRILDNQERQALVFGADALLPRKSVEKDREVHQLQNGTIFTIGGLKDIIAELAGEYEPMFPNSVPFFKLMYKLCGWDHLDPNNFIKPPIVALYIKKYVYARFEQNVLPVLLSKENPLVSGYIKKYKLFQFLNDKGLLLLESYIKDAIAVMEDCKDWYEFELKYTKMYKLSVQLKCVEVEPTKIVKLYPEAAKNK